MTSYWLGIDLGTTYTAAAVCWPVSDDLEVQVVPLSNHSHAIPSVLYLPGDGSLVVGEGAQRRSLTDPDRVVREFKSRVGDEIPLLVGGSPYYAHDLAAEFVGWICRYVVDREGERPEAVALTCPASWGPYKTGLFQRAVQDAGVAKVMVLSEPQAAAISYASRERVDAGATLAVYDLGGGTFDAAVSARTIDRVHRARPARGHPAPRRPQLRRGDLRARLRRGHVPIEELDPHDPAIAAEVARLRRECIEAKETLSADTDATIPVQLGGHPAPGPADPGRVRGDDPARPGPDRRRHAPGARLGRRQRRGAGRDPADRRDRRGSRWSPSWLRPSSAGPRPSTPTRRRRWRWGRRGSPLRPTRRSVTRWRTWWSPRLISRPT